MPETFVPDQPQISAGWLRSLLQNGGPETAGLGLSARGLRQAYEAPLTPPPDLRQYSPGEVSALFSKQELQPESTALEGHLLDYERQQRGEAAERGYRGFIDNVLKPSLSEWAHYAPMVLGAGRGAGGVPRVAGDAPAFAGRTKEFFNVNRAPPEGPRPAWQEYFNVNNPESGKVPSNALTEFFNANNPASGQIPRNAFTEYFNVNKPTPAPYVDPQMQAAIEANAKAQAERQAHEALMARAREAAERAAKAKNERMMNSVLDMEDAGNTAAYTKRDNLINQVLDLEDAANAKQIPLRHDPKGYNIMRNPEGIPPAPWERFRARYGVAGTIPLGAMLYEAGQEPR